MTSGAVIAESHVEEATMAWLSGLGYEVACGPDVEPEKLAAERDDFTEVVLTRRLHSALERIDPGLPASAIDDALKKVVVPDTPGLVESNHRFHRQLVDGIDVEYRRRDGSIAGDKAWLVDYEHPEANHRLAINQFTVIEGKTKKRPDVVVFVNGMPPAVIEIKNPVDVNALTKKALQQLQTYKQAIPVLFACNELLVASDGSGARHGTLTAPWERFMPWRSVDGASVATKGTPEPATLVNGIFEKRRFLDLDMAVQQIVSRAVSTEEVVDIFKVAGLEHPDTSVLDDRFLAEVRDMPRRNLAVELLEKLLRDEVKARFKTNLLESRRFSEMLQSAVVQHQNRAITSAQVIEELVALAKEIREAHKRGEDLGLSEDELAFYDALEANDSAVAVLGDEAVKRNAPIDWNLREGARARMRVTVKRLLRKYGYPPDKQEHATQLVLAQAEVVCEEWAA